MPANLENSAMATGLENVSFYSNPKESRGIEMAYNSTDGTQDKNSVKKSGWKENMGKIIK